MKNQSTIDYCEQQFSQPTPFLNTKMKAMSSQRFEDLLLLEGLDQIQNAGWAVAMQYRFGHEFERRGSSYYFLDYAFLDNIGLFTGLFDDGPKSVKKPSNGIIIQFGLDEKNELTLLLSVVHHAIQDPTDKNQNLLDRRVIGKIDNYYTPKHPDKGVWQEIDDNKANAYKTTFEQATFEGIDNATKITGYFVGREVINEIFANKTTLKLYLGMYDGNEISNYEDPASDKQPLNLQLMMVEADTPRNREIDQKTNAPLASFCKIFSTIECDKRGYLNGWKIDKTAHEFMGNSACIKDSPAGFIAKKSSHQD